MKHLKIDIKITSCSQCVWCQTDFDVSYCMNPDGNPDCFFIEDIKKILPNCPLQNYEKNETIN